MRTLITIASLIALNACGGGADQPGNDQAGKMPPAAEIDCSAVKPRPAPAGSPPNDVLGIRPGDGIDEAKLRLKCANKGFRFEPGHDGFALPEMPGGSRAVTRLTARRGEISGCDPAHPETMKTCLDEDPSFSRVDETVVLHLAGTPGQEKVIAVTRELNYPDGEEVAAETLGKDLIAKFGAEPDTSASFASSARLRWVFDGQGRRMSAANPDLASCANAVGSGSGGPSQLREGCRLTVNAWVDVKSDNPQLARSFGMILVDQQAALDAIGMAKDAIDGARGKAQQQETERARARSGGTTL